MDSLSTEIGAGIADALAGRQCGAKDHKEQLGGPEGEGVSWAGFGLSGGWTEGWEEQVIEEIPRQTR